MTNQLGKVDLKNLDQKVLRTINELDILWPKKRDEVLFLAPYLKHEDYLIRSKAFFLAALFPHPALLPVIAQTAHEDQDEEFRLRAIEVLQKLGTREALAELAKLLTDPDPLIVRGSVVAMGGISSPEAVHIILEYASSLQGRLVRPEVVQEAASLALGDLVDGEKLLKELAAENSNIRRYLRNLNLKKPEIPHFTVYPSADYFSLQAKKRGVDYRTYRYLIG